ncbi:hypothetical protein [Lactococcus garvieae]|nr:hypothetical protein [Lactococcus garvieae]
MKFSDLIMPHRFFINRSLNKASEKLKSKIDEYKIEYNSQVQRCQQEIEELKEKKNQDYMDVVNFLNKELQKDAELFEQFKNVFLKYVDLYFGKQLLLQSKSILRLEKKVKEDYGTFLTNQILAISDEIELLEERKAILNSNADISKILELGSISGCDIEFINDDITEVITTVQEQIDNVNQDDWIRKNTLITLKRVLQEHLHSREMIQYINWVIKQKKLISKQLANTRKQSNIEKKLLVNQISDVTQAINDIKEQMAECAKSVRSFWVNPILKLDVKIANIESTINKLYDEVSEIDLEISDSREEKEQVSGRIEDIKQSGSSDSSWDSLWSRKKLLTRNISDLYNKKQEKYSEINNLREDRKEYRIQRQNWFDRRNLLLSLGEKNKIDLKYLKKSVVSDEKAIAEDRISEINQKKIEFESAEKSRIEQEIKESDLKYNKQIQELDKQIQIYSNTYKEIEVEVGGARKLLSSETSKDSIFFVLKMFSDSPEVKNAKDNLSSLVRKKLGMKIALDKLLSEKNSLEYEREKIRTSIRPRTYTMNVNEREDINGYQRFLTNLSNKGDKKREGGYHAG